MFTASPAAAQYFGRNKVQYDRLRFQILETPHFDIYYYPAERDAAHAAARMAERWYDRLSKELDCSFTRRQPIVFYASYADFEQTSILPGFIPEGVGGFTDHQAGRVVLPFAAGLAETDHVLGHELVHAFQREILRKHGRSLAMVPLWFSEGMAEYLSIGRIDTNTRMWLRDAVQSDHLPTIAQLDNPRYFPYRYGQALWAFLAERYGSGTVLKALIAHPSKAAAKLEQATGRTPLELTRQWHDWIKHEVQPLRDVNEATSRAIIVPGRNGGRMNVGPALSPDGRYLVFLSERDDLSMALYLADAKTGAIIRKLLSAAADGHFDSLEFIDSAGAWSPDGSRFALGTLRDGHAAITVLHMPEGSVERELAVPNVDQIFSPSFAPDAERIAFSAMKGGFTDLYTANLENGAIEAMTSDAASDLQPSWSPDGRLVVFSSDRFSTSVDALSFGPYQLATIAPDTREIRPLGGLPDAKNIDPHWSADGSRVLFVSDAGGLSNVYALTMATGAISRVTDVAAGVSGITALSPAISVEAAHDRFAYSEYVKGAYEIRTADVRVSAAVASAPGARPLVSRPMATPIPEMPSAPEKRVAFASKPYVPRLSLVTLGEPYLSAGGGAFGSFLRAGMSVSFNDMLGEQQLDTAVQIGKRLSDLAFEAAYINRRSRWNWGLVGAQVPSMVGVSDVESVGVSPAGDRTIVRDTSTLQQTHRQIAGILTYPFSRALRMEFTGGVDSVRFDRQTTERTYSAVDGTKMSETYSSAPATSPATLFETSAAIVYDSAVNGATGPILGQRYRFSIAPSIGGIHATTAIADFRRYFMPIRPVTVAFRIENVGRFGSGSNDPRLLPLVWTLRDLVRGFPVEDALLRTSQYQVANIEARTPLVGLLGRGFQYGALPIDVVAFADAGRFSGSRPFLPSAIALASVGAGVRVNAAGFVFEFDAVHPIAGPARGWRLGVNFQPGF